jgi:hypothetical protein
MSQSAVSKAASLLGRRTDDDDEDFANPGIFAMSVRLPSNIASLVSAMADQAGCSRNEMANLIVEAGIDAILSATAPEAVADIHHDAESNIGDFIS